MYVCVCVFMYCNIYSYIIIDRVVVVNWPTNKTKDFINIRKTKSIIFYPSIPSKSSADCRDWKLINWLIENAAK